MRSHTSLVVRRTYLGRSGSGSLAEVGPVIIAQGEDAVEMLPEPEEVQELSVLEGQALFGSVEVRFYPTEFEILVDIFFCGDLAIFRVALVEWLHCDFVLKTRVDEREVHWMFSTKQSGFCSWRFEISALGDWEKPSYSITSCCALDAR